MVNNNEETVKSKDKSATIQKEAKEEIPSVNDNNSNNDNIKENDNSESKEDKVVEELTKSVADVTVQPDELILDEDDEDEGGEWITPENVNEFKAVALGVTPSELQQLNIMDVACMTSDFAMQVIISPFFFSLKKNKKDRLI